MWFAWTRWWLVMFLLVNDLLTWMKLTNCSGSLSWVIFSIGLCYFITGSAECSFLRYLLPRAMSTVNLFRATFSKSRLCIPKPRKQAIQAKRLLVFQHAAPFLPTFLLSCLLNSRSAPTSWYRSCLQVGSQDMKWANAQCLPCGCWDLMCFSGWEASVLLFHSRKAYGITRCNRGESWWVNDESLSLRQHSVLSKEKKQATVWNQLNISLWRFQALL